MYWNETLVDNPTIESEVRQGGLTPSEVDPKMLHDIQAILSRLVGKANQLLGNHTTNLAECWMHIRAKFDGGKCINRSQSGSWEHRCMGAGLRQNLGPEWGPQVWRNVTHAVPNKIFTDTADNSAKKVTKQRKRKATDKAKKSRRRSKYARVEETAAARSAYSRHDGGISPEEVDDDIPSEQLDKLKDSYYRTKVVVTEEEARDIERNTRDQAENEQWLLERKKRITASNVGGIAKMRKTTKKSKKVENILYSRFRGNEATRYGLAKEEETKQRYIAYQQRDGHPALNVDTNGLFVSLTNPWIAASPDGTVYDPSDPSQVLGLVEFKNPFSMRDKSLAEACRTSTFCLTNKKNTFQLKNKHDYYFQIQCQLYCVDREWCDFVLTTEKDIHVERIRRDRKWWDEKLVLLRRFYFDAVLPELACPRYRKGGIREPPNNE